MESKTQGSTTGDTTSTTWSFAPWLGAKTRQIADRAVSFARNNVKRLGSTYGHRLQESTQKVAHSTVELTTGVVHSVQEIAQKAGHRIDETRNKTAHRRQELVDEVDDKLDGG
jgi:hypothetical protein